MAGRPKRRARLARANRVRTATKKARKAAIHARAPRLDLAAMAEAKLFNGAPRYYFSMQRALGDPEGRRTPLSSVLWANRSYKYKTTPLGIYGYPLTPEYRYMLIESALKTAGVWLPPDSRHVNRRGLPYAGDAPYVYVIEAVEPQEMLYVGPDRYAHSDEHAHSALERMRGLKLNPKDEDPWLIYKEIIRKAKPLSPIHGVRKTKRPVVLRKLLLQAGYTSIVDGGVGAIHREEPSQGVFLTPTSFRVVEMMPLRSLAEPYVREKRFRTREDLQWKAKQALLSTGRLPPGEEGRLADTGEYDLRGVKWAGINLSGVDRLKANLTGADLTGADLTYADLTNVNLTNAGLWGANLKGANLNGANLGGAILAETNLTRANLTNANLRGAFLTGADLTEAFLTRADLTYASLERANLERANLTRADLTYAFLARAKLTRANLTRADLTEANLTRADLTRANLTGVKYDNLTKWPKNFAPPEE
jgi:uncharacterized protein YjbI with pentapeptide repeats